MATDPADLVALFEVDETGHMPEPSYNVAPTDRVPVVVEPASRDDSPPARRLEPATWGLVPAWSKDATQAARGMNARSETVSERRMFSASLERRRAIVPATGWYEWRKPERIPFYVHADQPIAFAGLYAWWKAPDGSWLLSTTILTADAVGPLAELHDRMPVVLAPDMWDTWLDADTPGDQDLVEAVVAAAVEHVDVLRMHEVSKAVGNVRTDGAELIAPVA